MSDSDTLNALERQQRAAFWKGEEQANRRLPLFLPQDPLQGAMLREAERIEEAVFEARMAAEEAQLLAEELTAHPFSVPAGRNFDWWGEMSDDVIVTEELKNADAIIRKNLGEGNITVDQVRDFYLNDPHGQKIFAYKQKMDEKFGDPGSGAEFEMMPIVKLSDQEKVDRQNAKVDNMENLRLLGVEGAALQDVSPYGPETTRLLGKGLGLRTEGPSRVRQPAVADMTTSAGAPDEE